MPKHDHKAGKQREKDKPRKKQHHSLVDASVLTYLEGSHFDPALATNNDNSRNQVSMLEDRNLTKFQRRAIATKYGQTHGNHLLNQIIPSPKRNDNHIAGIPLLQRDVISRSRIQPNVFEIRISIPTSYQVLESDVTQGLSRYVSGGRLPRYVGSIRQELMNYYGFLEQRVPELSGISLEIAIDLEAVTANLNRATDPGNPSEMVSLHPGGSPEGQTAETQIEESRVEETRPAPTTDPASEGEVAQIETPRATPTSETRDIQTIRLPFNVIETQLSPVPAGPVTIIPTYKLGGNLDVSSTNATTNREFRTNLRTGIPEIQQTYQDEFRQIRIENTAEGPVVSLRDRRINMEMEIKPGNVIELKSEVFPIRRRIGDLQLQANMDVTLSMRFSGNPVFVEAVLVSAMAAVSVGAFIHSISQIGAGIASGIQAFMSGLAQVGSRLSTPIIIILPREAIEEIMETGPGGLRQGGGRA